MKFKLKMVLVFIFIMVSMPGRFAGVCGAQDDIVRMQQEMEKNDEETAKKIKETLKEHGYETSDTAPVDVNSVMQNFQNTMQQGPKNGKGEGMSMPTSEWYWFFIIFLSVVGMGFFSIGKNTGDVFFILSGLIMMVYPYFVTTTWILITIGLILTIVPIVMTYKRQ